MSEPIDPTSYLRPPRLDVPSAISLCKMLKQAQPADLPAPVKRAAKRLDEAAKALEGAWREGAKATPKDVDVRRVDRRLDNLWSAVRDRLLAFSALAEGDPLRERAEGLAVMLFPEGLAFLLLPYLSQHAESQKRLDLIANDGLEKDLRSLVGARFIEELGAAHREYGAALGITAARPEAAPALRVVEPLREVQAALRAYTLQLLALAEADEGTQAGVRVALRPIDVVRTASGRRGAGGPAAEPLPPDGGGVAEPAPSSD